MDKDYIFTLSVLFENAMTKTVPVPGKAKRAGGGVRPVRVKERGISLLSSQNQRKPVVLNGNPPLSDTI